MIRLHQLFTLTNHNLNPNPNGGLCHVTYDTPVTRNTPKILDQKSSRKIPVAVWSLMLCRVWSGMNQLNQVRHGYFGNPFDLP